MTEQIVLLQQKVLWVLTRVEKCLTLVKSTGLVTWDCCWGLWAWDFHLPSVLAASTGEMNYWQPAWCTTPKSSRADSCLVWENASYTSPGRKSRWWRDIQTLDWLSSDLHGGLMHPQFATWEESPRMLQYINGSVCLYLNRIHAAITALRQMLRGFVPWAVIWTKTLSWTWSIAPENSLGKQNYCFYFWKFAACGGSHGNQ